MKVSILGNGIFGSSVSSYLTKIGHSVFVDIVNDSEIIFVCVTSNLVLSSLLKIKNEIENKKIVICSKGFSDDGRFISEILKEEFKNDIYFLYGPTVAKELEDGIFSGMVLAGGLGKEEIKKEIESENLYIELSDDIVGVEVSATFKNMMNIFVGIIEGSEYGQNTNALMFTKAIQEMKNIGLILGAKTETFLGLSCIGELYLSSRNRTFGIELGKGRNLEDIIKEINYTPAGVFDIKNAKKMIERSKINAPIIEFLNKIVFENYPIKDVIKQITKN
ncbi:MAG: Glycerol-3-phosphate dehydrogenase [NAD(P)+] [Candidatus Nomurabacteria bacterium GW2011_GWE1_32_28]|uniref:Glycerol-3-phosphate dehydrogenase [NAD(P)+] n=1 Tax=Candidatus Nomurabacteria bacterium GW2011_GWF1_31_48 TaxID=1618767 RepID=A0A0F9YFY0_9BACT|nr:MAG: Glycerol-3-phosphate dehydrogenase [NAD(P)+] [Candidatus Nomurabacteria bacterium GW2011_GWF2_30_133]KKP28746.1 MAG: Glycerol-3-phosphate dehydrogenase [NAD(P)+] [Candidatus Nomurabacteria bacterium GW2011_GWE2_31_40]KKP30323.1 MAG: Glycerol-3-phosphate dehydrogenase [NAD(P)+] [Candidatus Nomurabacteria bacterium GW2011_GWF1_31_48]KKP34850.1 MAG: Glycerol-3-phosphate dehydrogenase [NAD(P)+] [Candidatus Nomurabacteria bacterium GW2011_GWE1_32_28]HAS80692.1 hypothetical protein [Candidatu